MDGDKLLHPSSHYNRIHVAIVGLAADFIPHFRRLLQVGRASQVPTTTIAHLSITSNALTLEQLTTRYPHSGTLITFFQFLVISIYGLPRHATFTTKYLIPLPYLKPRRIPLTRYLLQVVLFYALSLLNNVAFSYDIPMPVHIIFRSGGLMISMIMGRFVLGRK